jgi:glucose 1-dehydrogenase
MAVHGRYLATAAGCSQAPGDEATDYIVDMRAITTKPGVADSARLEDLPEPAADATMLLVEAVAIGVCGTDLEILSGTYGAPPPGHERLVLGHENLGRVRRAPEASGFSPGELVVGVVRRPDPVPCSSCAAGEWDMCQNGRYTERGITRRDGYAAERYLLEPSFAVAVPAALGELGVLVEPTTIVAKAWEQINRIGARTVWTPRRVLITGAGPIGLLAALLARQQGLDVQVVDRVTDGPKPGLVAALGATYHTGPVKDLPPADIALECTGVGELVFDLMEAAPPNGIVCLTGVSSATRTISVNLTSLNKQLVLENNVVFGVVNANLRHYRAAVEALARADRGWLQQLVSRRVPVQRWHEALVRGPTDVKPVITWG